MKETDATTLIKELYRQQLSIKYEDYLHLQSRTDAGVGRRVDAFHKYEKYLTPGRILDWGCKHSIDGCLIRQTLGDKVEMYGCDVGENDFGAFHDYARLKFTQLRHPYLLPYEDDQFDVVIGSGVMEHVPNDSESLKELYRILKPGGRLIITFLPNGLSYTENITSIMKGPAHKRTYRASNVERDFLHHGFEPIVIGYHQVTPSLASFGSGHFGDMSVVKSGISFLYNFNDFLEKVPLLRKIAANLFVVARKVEYF